MLCEISSIVFCNVLLEGFYMFFCYKFLKEALGLEELRRWTPYWWEKAIIPNSRAKVPCGVCLICLGCFILFLLPIGWIRWMLSRFTALHWQFYLVGQFLQAHMQRFFYPNEDNSNLCTNFKLLWGPEIQITATCYPLITSIWVSRDQFCIY